MNAHQNEYHICTSMKPQNEFGMHLETLLLLEINVICIDLYVCIFICLAMCLKMQIVGKFIESYGQQFVVPK